MPRVVTTALDESRRRRMLVSGEGVLILGERRRRVGHGEAWCIASSALVSPDEVGHCAPDVQAAWQAYIAPLRDVGSTAPTRRLERP